MIRYKYISAAGLLVVLAACAAEEVESPMPEALGSQDEMLFHCAGGQKVRIIREEIYGETIVGKDGTVFDGGRESVTLAYNNQPLRFDSEGTGFEGPWRPAFENRFSLETIETDDPTKTSIELRDESGRVVIGNCQLDLYV